MRLRRVDIGLAIVAGGVGAVVPHGAIVSDAGRLLVIFTGLIAASVLPTISLMIANMSSTGRSTRSIAELRSEIDRIVSALLFVFGCACMVVMTLIGLTVDITAGPSVISQGTGPSYLAWGIRSVLQAALFASLAVLVNRSLIIPKAIRRSLELKTEIAIAEATRRLNENAPGIGATAQHFKKKENFGRTIPLSDLRTGND